MRIGHVRSSPLNRPPYKLMLMTLSGTGLWAPLITPPCLCSLTVLTESIYGFCNQVPVSNTESVSWPEEAPLTTALFCEIRPCAGSQPKT